MNNEHPNPGKWQWWASYDGGEHMTVGPAETRESLVDLMKEDRQGEYKTEGDEWRIAAGIGEYRENNIDLSQWFDADGFLEVVSERLDDNDCGSDEDGERAPLDEITAEQQSDLEARVRSTIREWQKKHDLKLKSYWFAESRNVEALDIPL